MKKIVFFLIFLQGCSYLGNEPLKVLSHESVSDNQKIKLPYGYRVNFDPEYTLSFSSNDSSVKNLTSIEKPPM
jgi:hypothetical protein